MPKNINTHRAIPPVFIINLKRDTDRRKHMEHICSLHNIEAEFIEAVNGADLTEEDLKKVSSRERSRGRHLSAAEIGCAMSHMVVYKKIVTENIPVALILEDDANFDTELLNFLSNIDLLPKYWDLIFLGYIDELYGFTNIWYKHRLTCNINIRQPSGHVWGAWSYLINQSAAKKLLHHMNTITKGIDAYTGNYFSMNIFITEKQIVTVNKSFVSSTDFLGRAEVAKAYPTKKSRIRKCMEFLRVYALFKTYLRPWVIRFKNSGIRFLLPPRKYS